MHEDRPSKSDLARQRILDAAEEEFAQKGLFGARVDEIARRAHINKRMLYEYFGNKEDLYRQALIGVYKKLDAVEEIFFSHETAPEDALRNIIRLHYRFLHDNPNFVRLVMWENLNGAAYLKQAGELNIKDVFLQAMRRAVVQGKQRGVFRSEVDEDQLPMTFIALSFSYFSNQYTLSHLLKQNLFDEAYIDARIRHVTDMVMSYLLNVSGRDASHT